VTEAVVGLSLDGIAENLVGLFHRGELRPCTVVVVVVGVVDPDLLAERPFDLLLAGVRGNLQQIVEVLCHVRPHLVDDPFVPTYGHGDYSFRVRFGG